MSLPHISSAVTQLPQIQHSEARGLRETGGLGGCATGGRGGLMEARATGALGGLKGLCYWGSRGSDRGSCATGGSCYWGSERGSG